MENWASMFVEEKGLGERVSLKGTVSDAALGILYDSADCVVIPSRSESIPLVFSEALRFDKDLVVADVGDMGVLGRKYGVAGVVQREDVPSLKDEMKKMIASGGTGRPEKGRREELLSFFNVETSVEKFLADYPRSCINDLG